MRAGDVIRFGRVCYLIKETSVDNEDRAVKEISQKQMHKQRNKENLKFDSSQKRGVNLEEKLKEDFHSIDAINDYFDNELTLEKNCTN